MILPILFTTGPAMCRCHQHPTLPQVMILDKWEGDPTKSYDLHRPSRLMSVDSEDIGVEVDGQHRKTVWLPAFSQADELVPGRVTPEALAKWAPCQTRSVCADALAKNIASYRLNQGMVSSCNLGLARHHGLTLEVVDFLEALAAYRAWCAARQAAERLAKAQKDKTTHESAMDAVEKTFMEGGQISPGMFEALYKKYAKPHGMTLQIQTIGSIRKRIRTMGRGQCHVYGKGFLAPGVYRAINTLAELITEAHRPAAEKKAEAAESSAVEHLFKPPQATP